MNLAQVEYGKEYRVKEVAVQDEELKDFLFTLGCYVGEALVVISKISGNFVVSIRDGRYNIDRDLAEAILVS